MTAEAMHIILLFQPLLKRKITNARLFEGRWAIQYRNCGIYFDLSRALNKERAISVKLKTIYKKVMK